MKSDQERGRQLSLISLIVMIMRDVCGFGGREEVCGVGKRGRGSGCKID